MIENLFFSIIEVSISTSFIAVLLIFSAPILNKRYEVRWKYWIWSLLALRLVIPFDWHLVYQNTVARIPAQFRTPMPSGIEIPITLALESERNPFGTLLSVLSALWLAGCFLFLTVHFLSYLHYKKQLKKQWHPIRNETVIKQLQRLFDELHIKHRLPLMAYSKAASPMVIGFLHPVLVLPDISYTNEELYFILKHELIHFKRHDLSIKLLLIIANAIHWFNPIIYIMQKEASVDMELSCDEMVIQNTSLENRKAYTETLLSALHKQYYKKTVLSTEFYGGTKIMKKRFQNILTRHRKKSGIAFLVIAIVLMLAIGITISCSPKKPDAANFSDAVGSILPSESGLDTIAAPIPAPTSDFADETEQTVSEDAQEIQIMAESFASAYFNGDIEEIKRFLAVPYDWDIEVFDGEPNVFDITLKGTDTIETASIGDTCTVSLEFKRTASSDTYQYLTIELIKQADGWRIRFYGLEG